MACLPNKKKGINIVITEIEQSNTSSQKKVRKNYLSLKAEANKLKSEINNKKQKKKTNDLISWKDWGWSQPIYYGKNYDGFYTDTLPKVSNRVIIDTSSIMDTCKIQQLLKSSQIDSLGLKINDSDSIIFHYYNGNFYHFIIKDTGNIPDRFKITNNNVGKN